MFSNIKRSSMSIETEITEDFLRKYLKEHVIL